MLQSYKREIGRLEYNFKRCIIHSTDDLRVELMRPQINSFNNPITVEIEKQVALFGL